MFMGHTYMIIQLPSTGATTGELENTVLLILKVWKLELESSRWHPSKVNSGCSSCSGSTTPYTTLCVIVQCSNDTVWPARVLESNHVCMYSTKTTLSGYWGEKEYFHTFWNRYCRVLNGVFIPVNVLDRYMVNTRDGVVCNTYYNNCR
jgi:hypothetical protein